MRRYAMMAVLLAAGIAAAGPPKGPSAFETYTIGVFKADASGQTTMKIPPALSAYHNSASGEWAITGPPGKYVLDGAWVDFDAKKLEFFAVPFEITGVTPPTPPTPPNPPNPDPPKPDAAPIPNINGLAVLIVEEAEDRNKLTADQRAMILGQQARDWLQANCGDDPSNSAWKAWRIYDKDQDVTAESQPWRDAMARKRDATPWLIVSNAKRGSGYEGPLPKAMSDFMAILKQHEGK